MKIWIDCEHCDGTGYNSIEGSCYVCGTRGVVFRKCCGCRDCTENITEDGECNVEDCPKDHDIMPAGDRHPMEV